MNNFFLNFSCYTFNIVYYILFGFRKIFQKINKYNFLCFFPRDTIKKFNIIKLENILYI